MTGVQRQVADLLQKLKSMDFSLAKKKGMYLDIGKMEVMQMALEKQVPKQTDAHFTRWKGRSIDRHYCNRCGHHFSDMSNYCPDCGQAIDWRK